MKKSFYKIISVVLCAVLLNISIISSMSVKSYCDDVNAVQWLHDNFNDAVSAIGGAVINTTVDCWNAWKTLLGLNEEEFNDFILNGVSVGGDGNITISDDVADSIKDFVDDYKNNNQDFRYVYAIDFHRFQNSFTSRARYESVLRFLNENKNKAVLVHSYYAPSYDPSGTDDKNSIQVGGTRAFYLIVLPDNLASMVLLSATRPFINIYGYNDDWARVLYDHCQFYGFANSGDTTLSLTSDPWNHSANSTLSAFYADYGYYPSSQGHGQMSFYTNQDLLVSSTYQQWPCYRTSDIMKNYTVGNLPYYTVPINPNIQSVNGSYNMTQTQLDNSISYGDISSYVETNNVTEMNVVNNYITNYYSNGSGGSGGSGSGGSGSDIDWSWLGTIGEVIGGLISALGNVISGIIEGITNLITSLTENLPNVFSSIIEWLLPFIPEEVTNLLSLLFMAIIIVGVVRLIRGK